MYWLARRLLLCAACCSQRVFLFAARAGYELPSPPPPRYEAQVRRVMRGSEHKAIDPTFMPKAVGDDSGLSAACWYDVLTAQQEATMAAADEGELLPHVTVAEAVGDLPPIMGGARAGSGGSSALQQGSTCMAQPQAGSPSRSVSPTTATQTFHSRTQPAARAAAGHSTCLRSPLPRLLRHMHREWTWEVIHSSALTTTTRVRVRPSSTSL
jgi:hypothetical protein